MATVHLHRDEVPETLALLNTLLGGRDPLPSGYAPDRTGADVDWELLADSYLSTSEKAVAYIAHGLAILESHGGKFELALRDQILAAVQTSAGSFYRRMPLPAEVKPEQIQASMTDGVLEVRVPRPAESKPEARKITVT
jgi:hypothetical protein